MLQTYLVDKVFIKSSLWPFSLCLLQFKAKSQYICIPSMHVPGASGAGRTSPGFCLKFPSIQHREQKSCTPVMNPGQGTRAYEEQKQATVHFYRPFPYPDPFPSLSLAPFCLRGHHYLLTKGSIQSLYQWLSQEGVRGIEEEWGLGGEELVNLHSLPRSGPGPLRWLPIPPSLLSPSARLLLSNE